MSSESEPNPDYPEWLPDAYNPDAPLRERLPIMADIPVGIEIQVQDGRHGTIEIVGQPMYFDEYNGTIELKTGRGLNSDIWNYEIVVPEDRDPFLRKCNPDQDYEAYESTRRTWLCDIDVRIYGVDIDRFKE